MFFYWIKRLLKKLPFKRERDNVTGWLLIPLGNKRLKLYFIHLDHKLCFNVKHYLLCYLGICYFNVLDLNNWATTVSLKVFMNEVLFAHEYNLYEIIFSSYILILMICMARTFYKPGYTNSAGFSVSNVLLVSPSFLFSLLHKGMLTVASCMCGLSNLYSESVKKLRTSYISKSSHGNKIFWHLNLIFLTCSLDINIFVYPF